MTNPFLPGPHWRTEQTIRVPYRLEQHEEEQVKGELSDPNVRWYHDPYWNRRFWSIQHVHDCIEGKTFHWFWSPMAEVFNLAQILFMVLPFVVYLNGNTNNVGWRGLILMCLSLQLLMATAKYVLRWYHEWRFRHIPYRIIHH